MAQTNRLAVGTTAGTSTNIVVAAGASAVIGIYTSSGQLSQAGDNFSATLLQVTLGQANPIAKLDAGTPSLIVNGPNTFQVRKTPSLIGIGVFSE